MNSQSKAVESGASTELEYTPYRSPAVEGIAAQIASENHGPHNCGECWFNEHIKTCDGCEKCVPSEWLL